MTLAEPQLWSGGNNIWDKRTKVSFLSSSKFTSNLFAQQTKNLNYRKKAVTPSGADFCWAFGGIICNFIPILPSFQHGGMKLEHYFFCVSKLSEGQRKRSSPKIEEFLFPKLSEDKKKKKRRKGLHRHLKRFLSTKSSEDQKKVQKSSSAQMQTIVKLLGGMKSNYWRRYIPPISPGCGTPGYAFTSFENKFNHFWIFCTQ